MAFECSGKAFIKVYRKFLEWEWYDNINTKTLFIHCLLRANWKPTKWHGIEIEAGQFVTSLPSLAEETQLTIQQVRTALEHLTSTGEITSKQQAKCRIITVNNWSAYQGDNSQPNRESTGNQQEDNREVTADKEIKNIRSKEEKNINIDVIDKYSLSFNEFWDNYPRRQDKGQAYKCYQARLNDGYTEEQLLTACKNYAAECEREKREKKYTKVASTFLSVNEPFVDYLKGESNDSLARRSREDEEQHIAEIEDYLKRYDAGEFDGEDEELRRIWEG